MSCTCRNLALRRFVLSISQVEVPVAASVAPRLEAPIRRFSSVSSISRWRTTDPSQTKRLPPAVYHLIKQSYSTEPSASEASTTASAAPEPAAKPTKNSDAILEFSLETLDELVSEQNTRLQGLIESKAQVAEATASQKPRQKDAPRKHQPPSEKESKSKKPGKAGEAAANDKSHGKMAKEAADRELPEWVVQKLALKEKFPEGWNPRRRLSPDAMAGIRALHAQFPHHFPVAALANHFEVSPEAIRRILRSKWQPSTEEQEKRMQRWQTRGEAIWERYAALGYRPPRKWRQEKGIGKRRPDLDHHMDLRKLARDSRPGPSDDMSGSIL